MHAKDLYFQSASYTLEGDDAFVVVGADGSERGGVCHYADEVSVFVCNFCTQQARLIVYERFHYMFG